MDKKAFKLGALFTSKTGDIDIKKEHINGEGYPVVSSGNDNTGILGCSDIEACVIPKNTITVDMFGNVYYRDFDYKMVTHARVFALLPNGFPLDEKTGLYFATSLAWLSHIFSYNNMCSYKKIKDMEIEIPVIKSPDPDHEYTVEDIDFEYMKQRIAELEKQRIAELDAYLIATGLDNYELTDEDKETLSPSTMQMFKEFAVKDILPQVNIKKYSKKPESEGNIPFVSCQTTNNGIASYCGEVPEVNHCITVSTNGNCFDCFWHNYPIIPSSDVEVLHKDGITDNAEISLYLCGVLSPNTRLYSYSNKPKNGKVFDTIIFLPVIESPDPDHKYTVEDIDFDYMERYIRATEKSVIADVVRYKDKMIEETKKIVEG